MQTSVDNTANDLHYEIKFENLIYYVKLSFFKQKYILFLETYFCKIPRNLIAPTFTKSEADTKKHRYASAKASNAALVKLTD